MSAEPLPKADPDFVQACPQPVSVTTPPAEAAAMADGLKVPINNPAEWAFMRLSRLIDDFEKGLNRDEEIGARIAALPGDGTMKIEDVGFWGPDLILFKGQTSDGKPVRLVQHYTQLNVAFQAVVKASERDEPRRIGFQLSELVERNS